MRTYSSNAEYFAAILSLVQQMERNGCTDAASDIRGGFKCLNGLTDGWAELMESLERTIARHGKELPSDQAEELQSAFEAAKRCVYRT